MQNNNTHIEFNKNVTLVGIYSKSFLSKKDQGDHLGHYKIVVNDSLEVNLLPPYLEESVRPQEEVQRFEGKKVSVNGIITENTSFSKPSLENPPVKINVPCFITIESIHLAKE